jgi:monoamine oxidase
LRAFAHRPFDDALSAVTLRREVFSMGRTLLFTKLSRIFTRAAAARDGVPAWRRREFLELGLASAGTAALGACDDRPLAADPGTRVAVVGAGLAGLHCAYRLMQAGVPVTVYEASSRVGGRTFTARGEFPDDQIAELGGELIDSNHVTMHALAEEFGIELDDRLADPPSTAETWWVAGSAVPEATVVEQFSAVAERMLADLEAADDEDDDTAYTELDETPLADYLDEVVPSADYPELHALLTSAYRGEFGLETSEQSALNLIYLIGSDEPDPFRIFGESDERYHAHQGSDAFAQSLAGALGDAVKFDRKLVAIHERSEDYELRFESEEGEGAVVYAEHVVLAIPFSTLRHVELDVELSDDKRTIIDELGYGTNAKVMGAFSSRVWRDEHDASGSVTSDAAFQQTWDSSIGQDGEHGLLTNFLGGRTGEEVGDADVEGWFGSVVADLEQVFPGIEAAYVAGSARRMHWPSAPFALGSYTCYRPGQWAFWGLEGRRENDIHFCGEHTSPDFQGWMEGAAETGAFAAAQVLRDLRVANPPELDAILEEKLPQEPWDLLAAGAPSLSPLARRRLLGVRAK